VQANISHLQRKHQIGVASIKVMCFYRLASCRLAAVTPAGVTDMAKGIEWTAVDTDTFPANVKTAYDKFVSAYETTEKARSDFEQKAKEQLKKQGSVPEGKVATFNYTGKALLIGFKAPGTIEQKNKFSFQ
jgi:hypothetical protein